MIKKAKQITYEKSDKVLLYDETVRRGRSKKLNMTWIGPYEVMEKHANENYTIKKGCGTLRTHANLNYT